MKYFQTYIDFENEIIVTSEFMHNCVNCYCQEIDISDIKDQLTPKRQNWLQKLINLFKK